MSGPRAVLGISESHCSTAALLLDGDLVACVSEERFSRVKNTSGFPWAACQYVLKEGGVRASELDAVVLSNESPTNHFFYGGAAQTTLSRLLSVAAHSGAADAALGWRGLRKGLDSAARALTFPRLRRAQVADISAKLGVAPSKLRFQDHHLSHAYSALYFLPDGGEGQDWCVLTLDGIGDGLAGTVSRYRGGRLERLAAIDYFDSLGLLYSDVTEFLGMKPNEHEYKVMGLAPYADERLTAKGVAALRPRFQQAGLGFSVGLNHRRGPAELRALLGNLRFDGVAGAIQQLTEEHMLSWARAAVAATGSKRVAASGGCFMNVKANMLLREDSGAEDLVLCPSAGDESNAIGAAYGAYLAAGGAPRSGRKRDLYLGPAFGEDDVRRAVAAPGLRHRYRLHPIDDPAAAGADLLARGEVLSTLLGRMEFGARSLGNRSILGHPNRPGVVREINHAIKMRDFWMPFAGTVLDRRAGDYLDSRHPLRAPYMMTGYATHPKAHLDLANAIHPYDRTMRPQVLEAAFNPVYYRLIEGFERHTGIGGVLNTSFNLHGEPVVCSPADAIHTLEDSHLKWLLTDRLLVEKEAAA